MAVSEKDPRLQTARLMVEVTYDPAVTDAEAIASAADRLWETALSTPEILDEYGNPSFAEFQVADWSLWAGTQTPRSDRPAPTTSVILNIYGGIVQEAFCSDPNTDIRVVDWDTNGHDLSDPAIHQVTVEGKGKRPVFVGGVLANSLTDLAGTDVEQALRAAEVASGTT